MITQLSVCFWGAEGAPILFSEIGFCMASCSYIYTVYLEIFARRNFHELPAELNFRVFIFANGDLTIYIVYIANDLY